MVEEDVTVVRLAEHGSQSIIDLGLNWPASALVQEVSLARHQGGSVVLTEPLMLFARLHSQGFHQRDQPVMLRQLGLLEGQLGLPEGSRALDLGPQSQPASNNR
jgi:hypothetical protein